MPEFISREKKRKCSRISNLNFYTIKTSGKLSTPCSSIVSSNNNQPLFENAIDRKFPREQVKNYCSH